VDIITFLGYFIEAKCLSQETDICSVSSAFLRIFSSIATRVSFCCYVNCKNKPSHLVINLAFYEYYITYPKNGILRKTLRKFHDSYKFVMVSKSK